MLTVHNVNKQYPGNRQALRGASFELREGERVILLGPNGAGKTTLIKCIVGLVAPDGGSIHLNGVDVVCRSSYARQSVAVVFEEADNSYSYLTVRENLLYFGLLNRLSMAEAKQKADKLLDLFGLSEHAHRLTQTLSRGMKQKLAFSIALMKGAPLLFLDEPTLGLDVESQRQMRHLLMEKSEWWNTVLITTHDIPFAHAVGERFLFMKNGEIIWEGTKDRFATPDDLETAFLSAIGVGSRA